jgi:hypothetical protein
MGAQSTIAAKQVDVVYLGCPRNNQFIFSVWTETNQNSICFGCFSICFAKPKYIFSVCFDRYQNNQNKQNFVQTNRKNLQKMFSIRGCSNRNKSETQSVSVVFRYVLSWNQKVFFSVYFSLFQCFGPVSKQPKQTDLWYGELKRLIFYKFFCCFSWSFVCFGCSKHRNSLFRY